MFEYNTWFIKSKQKFYIFLMYRQNDKSPGGTRQGCARSTFPQGKATSGGGFFPLHSSPISGKIQPK